MVGRRLSGWPEKARHEGTWELCLGRAWGPLVPPQSPRGPQSPGRRFSVAPHKGTRGLDRRACQPLLDTQRRPPPLRAQQGEANRPLRSPHTHRPQEDGHREPSNHRPGISQLSLSLPQHPRMTRRESEVCGLY